MKRLGLIGGAALLMFVAGIVIGSGTACAQEEGGQRIPELSTDWNIRAGLFIFNSRTARAKVGSVGFSGMVERRVHEDLDYDINIGIGYSGWSTVYSVPIMATMIEKRRSWRFGGGAGYAFGKRISGAGTSGTALGFLLGYELVHGKNPISADLRYNFIGGSSNELDGYSFTIGMKF